MIEGKPSRTAQFVAASRALGALFPDEAQLADDPFGARVSPAAVGQLVTIAKRWPAARPLLRMAAAPMMPMVAYMQVRTRIIDDVARRFVARHGDRAQIVLLGAGFDARAARLPLGAARVFEIDHPATQRLKRERFGDLPSTYGEPSGARRGDSSEAVPRRMPVVFVPWDFMRDKMSQLGDRLHELGHDRARPTLTIWEGVTMYLTEEAIAATVAAVHGWSAPASQLCFSYIGRGSLARPNLVTRLVAATVRRWGEPWRFGWDPRDLPAWLTAHSFRLVEDDDIIATGRRLLPMPYAALLRRGGDRHIAVAEPL